MARKQLTDPEREQIRQSLAATRERRKNQILKVFELKVNCHQTSKETYDKMKQCFIQAKWVYNDMLGLSDAGKEDIDTETIDIFKYDYLSHKTIHRYNKDGKYIEEKITLPTFFHRGIIQQCKSNIVNLAKAKRKGYKVGALKFKSEYDSIPLLTGSFKIIDNSHIYLPGFKNLKVYGLHQILSIKDYEIANGRFIKKASGYYIHVSVCINKNSIKQREQTYNEVGLDFGIKDNITTSDGEKFNCNVRESEYLKFLQKQLHRKQKDSKRYWRLRNQIRKEYEHLTNKKVDDTNKLIHYLTTNYDTIYFQDEQISKWKKKKRSKKNCKKCGNSFGRQIQCSFLGRVKAKLVSIEGTKSFKIDKFQPTTKLCTVCGCLNTLSLADRIFRCACGYTEDRDIHAAKNVKFIGTIKRTECLEQASVETLSSTVSPVMANSKIGRRNEKEDSGLKARVSSLRRTKL